MGKSIVIVMMCLPLLIPTAQAVTLNPGTQGIYFNLSTNAIINWQVAMNVDSIQTTSDALHFTVLNTTYSIQVVTENQISMTMRKWCPACTGGAIIGWDGASPVVTNPSYFNISIPPFPRAVYSIFLNGQALRESKADGQGRFSFTYDGPWTPHSIDIHRISAESGEPDISFNLTASYVLVSENLVKFDVDVDPPGDYTFLWDFGDGQLSNEQSPTHRYDYGLSKRYNVRLTVCSQRQCTELTQQIGLLRWTYLAVVVGVLLLIALLNLAVVRRAWKRDWVSHKG